MASIHRPIGFRNNKLFVTGVFLFKVNTIAQENGLWNVSLKLLCNLWTGKYLLVYLVSSFACHLVLVSVLSMFCSHRHTGPNDGLSFLVLALNVVHKWYSQIWYCSSLYQFCKLQSHNSNAKPINRDKILFCSKSVILMTNQFKSDQRNQIFKEF